MAPRVTTKAAPKTAATKTSAKTTAKAPAKTAVKAPVKSTTTPAKTAKKLLAAAVTVKHLAAEIAVSHELSKRQAEAILTGAIDLIVSSLRKGSRVRLGGLGILQVKKRAARVGRNPATGESIKIKASKKVSFRALKELKEAI